MDTKRHPPPPSKKIITAKPLLYCALNSPSRVLNYPFPFYAVHKILKSVQKWVIYVVSVFEAPFAHIHKVKVVRAFKLTE